MAHPLRLAERLLAASERELLTHFRKCRRGETVHGTGKRPAGWWRRLSWLDRRVARLARRVERLGGRR